MSTWVSDVLFMSTTKPANVAAPDHRPRARSSEDERKSRIASHRASSAASQLVLAEDAFELRGDGPVRRDDERVRLGREAPGVGPRRGLELALGVEHGLQSAVGERHPVRLDVDERDVRVGLRDLLDGLERRPAQARLAERGRRERHDERLAGRQGIGDRRLVERDGRASGRSRASRGRRRRRRASACRSTAPWRRAAGVVPDLGDVVVGADGLHAPSGKVASNRVPQRPASGRSTSVTYRPCSPSIAHRKRASDSKTTVFSAVSTS